MQDIDREEDYYGDVERLLEALKVEDYRMREFDDVWNSLSGRDRLAVSDLLYDYGL